MEKNRLTARHLKRLPLFPLQRVVFFPHTLLPLHVFEPRYRELCRWCLEHDWPMAIPLIRPPAPDSLPVPDSSAGLADEPSFGEPSLGARSFGEPSLGAPRLAEVCGVGRIARHERLPDGRHNLILEGLCRVRLDLEVETGAAYRVASAHLLTDPAGASRSDVADRLVAVRTCLTQLGSRVPALSRVLTGPLAALTDPEILACRLSAVLFHRVSERQALLECLSLTERLDRIIVRLGELLAGALGDDEPRQ